MKDKINNPRQTQDRNPDRPSYYPEDQISKKEGGEDLSDASPNDSRADEKVIVNEQREHKTVNAPSQTAANTSESISNDEETIDS